MLLSKVTNSMCLSLGTPTVIACDLALRYHIMNAAEVLDLKNDIDSLELGKKVGKGREHLRAFVMSKVSNFSRLPVMMIGRIITFQNRLSPFNLCFLTLTPCGKSS